MQTIGERFEDMRKRKGVSLREAAEATKIRGDYLTKFESNQFDIGLSAIYVRGFLRAYANFLKLPPDRILNDFESLGHNDARPRQPSREVYGRMDLSVSTAEERAERPAGAAGEAPAAESSGPAHTPRHRGAPLSSPSINPALVFKSLKWVGLALGVLLLIWIGKAIFGGSSEHAASPAPAAVVAPASDPTVTVIATDPVRVKVVRQSNGEELFQGQMEKGERREFPNVPLWVTATALESVRLEYKGKEFMIQAKGYNRVPVDATQFAR
jgi:cytoskeleton protein RodZ